MTLYDLVSQVTLQGDIRISVWADEEEDVIEFENCEYLSCHAVKRYENLEILYILSATDNKLHIELEAEDGWDKWEVESSRDDWDEDC